MAKHFIVANWKMYVTSWREAKQVFDLSRKTADTLKKSSLVIAPSTIYLRELAGAYRGKRIAFAAQNISPEPSGAHTGETSFTQVKDSKISYALVGHSERRAAGETNEETGKKVAALLGAGMTPILCVGERQRTQNGDYLAFVRDQLHAALADVPANKIAKVIIGYEPVWAIGGEKTMQPRDMHEMAIYIRKLLVETHGEKAMDMKILYGGSVNEENARPMLEEGDVVGFIVGHVSADPKRFSTLLRSLE